MEKNILQKMRIKTTLSVETIELLNSIEYLQSEENYLKGQIRKYIKNNYPLDILAKNWKEIVKLGRDSSTLTSYVIRYGDTVGKQLHEVKTKSCIMTKDRYIKKYGEEQANRLLSSRGASLENFVKRHGDIEGNIRWKKYCEKRSESYKIGKEQKKYPSRNLAWFKNKYGDEKGYEVWNKKRLSQAHKVSKKYYIEVYGEELGTLLCKQNKTRNLENFIAKYGIEEGTVRYKNWVNKIVCGLDKNSYSKWSYECCVAIKDVISDLYYFGENEMVWHLPIKHQNLLNQKIIRPDLFYQGKVIEFMGDVFHANPLMYESEDSSNPYKKNIKASEIWAKDQKRKEYYLKKGYQYLEVWENDYKLDKQKVIDQCVNFLK